MKHALKMVLMASLIITLVPTPLQFSKLLSASASEACEWVEGRDYEALFQEGDYDTLFRRGDQARLYQLSVYGDVWALTPYGYHATGYLTRGSTALDGEGRAGGLADISLYRRPFGGPSGLFADRPGEAIEYYGYPHVALGPEQIELIDHRENFSISSLSGEAKIYDFISFDVFPGQAAAEPLGLLSILVTDGCADFSTTLVFEYSDDINAAASTLLLELQTDLQILVTDVGP